ncbi:MAG TPA: MoaD/ThiS family protein [Acidimicrobiales bacterium]|nr:MoaD/ThiS family protein [Acidimicrobiales bacterium]
MARLRLFAAARQAAGTTSDTIPGRTVGDVLDAAVTRYGSELAAVIENARVWLNGDPADRGDPVRDDDEVAVLPPVSGGA